jgi:hypothetical protein
VPSNVSSWHNSEELKPSSLFSTFRFHAHQRSAARADRVPKTGHRDNITVLPRYRATTIVSGPVQTCKTPQFAAFQTLHAERQVFPGLSGGRTRTRTRDPLIKSDWMYVPNMHLFALNH